jgi:RNA polymerase-binding transcription factor DksA
MSLADLTARSITSITTTRAAVEDALAKIGDGTYGSSEKCGRLIHLNRLKAIP